MRRSRLRASWLPFGAFALAISLGCENNGGIVAGSASAIPSPTPTATASVPSCPLQFAAPQMLYPIPGASGVPDGPQTFVFTAIPQTGVIALLTDPAGDTFRSAAFSAPPSPLPSPLASPPSGATLAGAAVPALAPATTYRVTFQDAGPCTSPIAGSAGSFTTK